MDHLYLAGNISDDAFLASLYERDNLIELQNYSPDYSSLEQAQNTAEALKNMSFQQLNDRVIQHSKLLRNFFHFRIIRFETFEESKSPDEQNIPFLLSKRANINRYYEG